MPESQALGNVRPDLFVVTTVFSDEGGVVLRLRVRQKRQVMIAVPLGTWMARLRCGRCRTYNRLRQNKKCKGNKRGNGKRGTDVGGIGDASHDCGENCAAENRN